MVPDDGDGGAADGGDDDESSEATGANQLAKLRYVKMQKLKKDQAKIPYTQSFETKMLRCGFDCL